MTPTIAEPPTSQEGPQQEAKPVKPTRKPFESKLDGQDLTLGEKMIFDSTSALLGALSRLGAEKKYSDRLVARLERDDPGNPLTPYVKLVAQISGEVKTQIDKDPEFQAGIEAAERRAFMERMGMGMRG